MKAVLKKILQFYLKIFAKITLLIHRPLIIAIAGSTNKTFVKQVIKQQLENQGRSVRANHRGFNTEIGLPLAILDLPSGYNDYKNWLPAILGAWSAVWRRRFPDILILELGISDPGDASYLLSIIKPKISIITDISQRYIESFSDMNRLVGEYEYLVSRIDRNGLVILNYDNIRVRNLAKAAKKTKIKYFSLKHDADCRLIEAHRQATGQNILAKYGNKTEQLTVHLFGEHHIYSQLIGLIIKYEFEEISL